jgi:hypothetical protein
MIGRTRHLRDEALFDCYVANQSGDALDARHSGHLAGCGDCCARLTELTQFMDGLRAEAEAETDAVFTPEQLRHQQQQILRRIEHLGHPARVISFPGRLVRRHLTATAIRIAPRWAVAAAAVGLFVGVGVGSLLDSQARIVPMSAVPPPVRLAAPIVAATVTAPEPDDDAFLSQLEAALGGPNYRELLPFDALTPRVQEISGRPLGY